MRSLDFSRRTTVVLLLVVLLGFTLRVYRLGAQSLWFDEAFAVNLASNDFLKVPALVESDPHPPLYFMLLSLWIGIAGTTEFAVRMPSMLAGVLLVPCLFVTARRLTGDSCAKLVSLVAAISPFLIYYAQETRMYALLVLLAVLATYGALRLIERPRVRWLVAYAAAATALVYTHYYGLLILLFHSLIFLVATLGKQHDYGRTRLRYAAFWLAALGLVALAFLPWAWLNAYRIGEYSQTWQAFSASSYAWQLLTAFGLGHSVERYNAVPGDPGYEMDHQRALWLGLIIMAVTIFGLVDILRRNTSPNGETKSRDRLGLVAVAWLFVPATAVYLFSVGRRDFTSRYLISIAPAMYLLVANGVFASGRVRRWIAWPAGAIVLVVMAFATWNYFADAKFARDDNRSAAAFVESHSSPNEAIILNAGYSQPAFDYYYNGRSPRFGLPSAYPPDEERTAEELSELASKYDYLWLVLWQDYFSDPKRLVEGTLNSRYTRTREVALLGNIKVRGYRTRSAILKTVPQGAHPIGRLLGDQVELVAHAGTDLPVVAGEELELTLFWRAIRKMTADYTVFAHLLNGAGQLVAQTDGPPDYGRLQTRGWPVASVVEDGHRLRVPLHSPPGDYSLVVGMYDPLTMRRLGDGANDRVQVQTVRVLGGGSSTAVPNQTNWDFGGTISLIGYELAGNTKPGTALQVDLFWQSRKAVADDYTVFVHLVDESGHRIAQDDAMPAKGTYPTSGWSVGEVVRDRHSLEIPSAAPAGQYSILVGMYEATSGRRLSYRQWPWSGHQTSVSIAPLVPSTQ